jgi:hypothetical protein
LDERTINRIINVKLIPLKLYHVKKVFLVLTTISLFLFSCKKNDGPAKLGITDVYVAGKDFNTVVALWHNGQQLFWEGTYGWIGDAYGVTILDTNVYVAGNRDNRALYWKNGEEIYLSDPDTETAVARSIFFAGNDMYIAGTKLVPSNAYQAGYWKNGVLISSTTRRIKTRNVGTSQLGIILFTRSDMRIFHRPAAVAISQPFIGKMVTPLFLQEEVFRC